MNIAGNFFKDIKENTSINSLSSKLKNISQTYLPETKEIISTIQAAVDNDSFSSQKPSPASNTNKTSSTTQPSTTKAQNQAQRNDLMESNKQFQQQPPRRTSAIINDLSGSTSHQQQSMNSKQSQVHQAQKTIKKDDSESDLYRHSTNKPVKTQLQQETQKPKIQSRQGSLYRQESPSPPLSTSTSSGTNVSPSLQQAQQVKSPPKPRKQPQPPVQQSSIDIQSISSMQTKTKTESEITSTSGVHSGSISTTNESSINKKSSTSSLSSSIIDPVQFNALVETNQVLKEELQRLSVYELKCKSLEKEAKNVKELKELNEKLESDLKRLNAELKSKCAQYEEKISELSTNTASKIDEEEMSTVKSENQKLTERLEAMDEEKTNLKNKINDLDKLVSEYEQKYNDLKQKELQLEKQNKHLENELDRLSENKQSKDEMHSQKLEAIEQANKVLEEELQTLKEQQKQERLKLKEKMDLLNTKNAEKVKKLEEMNKNLEERLANKKQDDQSQMSDLLDECQQLRKRVNELEIHEAANGELQRNLNQIRSDMKAQTQAIAEEKKKLDAEHRKIDEQNKQLKQEFEFMLDKCTKLENNSKDLEMKMKSMQTQLDKKEQELKELSHLKQTEESNFLSKLSLLNDENVQLSKQLKALTHNFNTKEDELAEQKRLLNELSSENQNLQARLKSYLNLENELVDVHMKNSSAQEQLRELESKLDETQKRSNKELNEYKNQNQQSQQLIKQLKQQLTAESLKVENLNTDLSLLKLELNKMDAFRLKCDNLERELNETKIHLNHQEQQRRILESGDKREGEIKLLNAQMINLLNDLKIKDQEYKQLEKQLDLERQKTTPLLKQLDELSALNTQLTMQNADAKRRLISLELLTEECNQLRKNLTLTTIESESRKAEVTTLVSQITILEATIKSLRDSSEKHTQLEQSFEQTALELKKKHDDYKKLQQLHETVKKEQLDTIELLEEKLKDVEKKTELQALKHEEILLELESIRARRQKLTQLCSNCSSQILTFCQTNTNQYHSQSGGSQYQSQMNSPQLNSYWAAASSSTPTNLLSRPYEHQGLLQAQYQAQMQASHLPHHYQLPQAGLPHIQHHHPHQQQSLLSISMPPQSALSPNLSPIQPFQQIQQAHYQTPQYQVYTMPNKQLVTVECQTSPLSEFDPIMRQTQTQQIKKKIVTQQSTQTIEVKMPKSNAMCQTLEAEFFENKGTNTDQIELNELIGNRLSVLPNAKPVVPQKSTKNQAVNCDLYNEFKPKKVPKSYEDKGVQIEPEKKQEIIETKQKYVLYLCKYSYDPFKSSPNDYPEHELPLTTGEYLFMLSEDDEDGFYMGQLLNGRKGLVPSNFVERITLDQNNVLKILQTLPTNVLNNSKINECLQSYNLDVGPILVSLQQIIKKLEEKQTQIENEKAQALASLSKQLQATTKAVPGVPIQAEDSQAGQVKIGLPYPNNLRLEKQSDTSLLAKWDPPTAPISLNQSIEFENYNGTVDIAEQILNIQCYNIFLNNELYCVINDTEERKALLERIDFNSSNRISIQAITTKGLASKPQECTMVFGLNRSLSPSNLSVQNITQTSAIVSWWPSSSVYSHIISIDSLEHRTLKPGVHRFKLSGLLPDTSHLINITALIPNHTNESTNNYVASIEFRTLAPKVLGIPQNLSIERDKSEQDSFILQWQPVVAMPSTLSNGIQVGGYSIYLDGVRAHQILNPYASSVSLNSKLLFNNGAKLLTIRTMSLDGNAESKDSEPIKLSTINTKPVVNEIKKPQPIQAVQSQPVLPPTSSTQNQQQHISNATNSSFQPPQQTQNFNSNNEMQTPKKTIETKPISNNTQSAQQNNMNEFNQVQEEKKQSTFKTPNQFSSNNEPSKPQQQQQAQQQTQPKPPKPTNNPLANQIPRITEGSRKKIDQSKANVTNDADLYENNKSQTNTNNNTLNKGQKGTESTRLNPTNKTSSNQSSQLDPKTQSRANPNQTAKVNANPPQQAPINNSKKTEEKNYKLFVALFEYDPYKMSPNQDSCEEELPFKEGDLIKVFGEQDADGFLFGELNGRSGFIPCNMVTELQVDDLEMVKRLLNENPNVTSFNQLNTLIQRQVNDRNLNSPNQKRKTNKTSTPSSSTTANTNQQTNSSKNKATKSSSSKTNNAMNEKESSFVPINNNKNSGQNCRAMLALYDYDPQSLSPNADADVELPFRTGEIIMVIGEMDEDGFYLGELNGKRGLVPSNFLQPVQNNDQEPNHSYNQSDKYNRRK